MRWLTLVEIALNNPSLESKGIWFLLFVSCSYLHYILSFFKIATPFLEKNIFFIISFLKHYKMIVSLTVSFPKSLEKNPFYFSKVFGCTIQ